jgi:hypothetical protein
VSETRKNVGLGAVALIPIACCIGIPLTAGAWISVAVAARAGGAFVVVVVLVAVVVVLALRLQRRNGRQSPLSTTRSR